MSHNDARGLLSSIENSFAGAIDTLLGLTTTADNQQTTTSSAREAVTTSLSSPLSSSESASTTRLTTVSSVSKSKSSKTSSTATQSTTTTTVSTPSSSRSLSNSETSLTTSSSASSRSRISSNSASTTITTIPSSPVQSPISTAIPSPSDGNRISPGGIAVAVIFGVIIATVVAYIIIKWCPAIQGKFARRQRRKQDDRTYRKGLDRDDEESMVESPNSGTGLGLQYLRPFSFYTSATYWPGRSDTGVGGNEDALPTSDRGYLADGGSLPRSLTAAPKSYVPYRPEGGLGASAIGMAVPMRSSSPTNKGLPPVPVG